MTRSDQTYPTTVQPAEASADTGRLMRLATYAAVSVAMTLIVGKLAAWFVTGSVAMLGSLIDSVLDAGASMVNLLAVRHALTPADREHRFGHGKAEALAGLAQAAFVCGSAGFLFLEAVNRLHQPHPIEAGNVGIIVIVASIVLTVLLVAFQRHVVRRTESVAIRADSLHYRGDLFMNLGVLAALVLSTRYDLYFADPLFGFAIGAYLGYGAWSIFRQSRDHLMDRELPDEQRRQIREIAGAHPKVLSMHDLRTRSSGINTFIQLHLELDPDMSLVEAHEISDEVEAMIRAVFTDAEVIIHQDPYGVEEERASFRR